MNHSDLLTHWHYDPLTGLFKKRATGRAVESMLRATDAASLHALMREFIAEARNVLAHLDAIESACEADTAEQSA